MTKLSRHQTTPDRAVIRIEGRLDAEAAAQLADMLQASEAVDSVAIDLSGVTSLDASGREYLLTLKGRGCRLEGGSLYVKMLLQEVNS